MRKERALWLSPDTPTASFPSHDFHTACIAKANAQKQQNTKGESAKTYTRLEFKAGQQTLVFHDDTASSSVGNEQLVFVGVEVLHIGEEKLGSATACVLHQHFLAFDKNLLLRPLGVLKLEFPASLELDCVLKESKKKGS